MKRTISKFILGAALLFIHGQGISQANRKESFSINFGPEVAFPENALNTTHRISYGGSFKGEYTFGKHASATINSGILVFQGREYLDEMTLQPDRYKNLTAIPVKAGLRYYVGNFYAAGEAGIVFLNNYTNTSRPVLGIGVGDKIRVGQGKIDISLRQEFWLGSPENLNMAVLRVAYEIIW